ncbi:hypothetical protein RIF29_20594 [Crotalaria pallida]|uniref:K+ potassium transporter integral membrane domain-containing protein n=1 Tax=Crotalaria pallida TaxID=3830 RepID=A0AAN9F5V2_CROPI
MYTKSTFDEDIQHSETNEEIYGVLSFVFWTLTLIPLLKYVFIVLRADDNGEGACGKNALVGFGLTTYTMLGLGVLGVPVSLPWGLYMILCQNRRKSFSCVLSRASKGLLRFLISFELMKLQKIQQGSTKEYSHKQLDDLKEEFCRNIL